MYINRWMLLSFLLWIPGCPGFSQDSRIPYSGQLAFQTSPPGSFEKQLAISIRIRQETCLGIYGDYQHETIKYHRVETDLFRMGLAVNIFSNFIWIWNADGGIRVMGECVGYEFGLSMNNFSMHPVAMHFQMHSGNLEGAFFRDISVSGGVLLWSIIEFDIGFRQIYVTHNTSQTPFIGFVLWM